MSTRKKLPKLRLSPPIRYPENLSTESLADHFLKDALESLSAAGNPEVLYLRRPTGDSVLSRAASSYGRHLPPSEGALRLAAERRATFSRTSIIVTAFAVEALANVYLATHFPEDVFEPLDRLKTLEKIRILPKLVKGKTFDKGKQPYQDIAALAKLRNQLAHARLGNCLPSKDYSVPDPIYNPVEAVRYLIAAAKLGVRLAPPKHVEPNHATLISLLIATEPSVLIQYAGRITDKLPIPTDDPPPNLYWELLEASGRRSTSTEGPIADDGTATSNPSNGASLTKESDTDPTLMESSHSAGETQ